MKSYYELIDQTYDFPTEEFSVKSHRLFFNKVDLMDLIKIYGTPFKLSYLPKIANRIAYARSLFMASMTKRNYSAEYTYCYCTKSSYFAFVLEEVLRQGAHIETSSSFDIPMLLSLYDRGLISKEHHIICNGFKPQAYLLGISNLIESGFKNCLPVLDNQEELKGYLERIHHPFDIGIRIAADEEPNFEFYTSRLGIRYSELQTYYEQVIAPSCARLKMLHFFIHTGIKDSAYFWSELSRFVYTYCRLKKSCSTLDTMDIGGGFPIKNSLQFSFDYAYMVDQIVENIQWICQKNHVPVPNICTEFGTYTVGETGAVIYAVLGQKKQNDKEIWYMIDGSFITHLPDVWGLNRKYVLLPINSWRSPFHKVNLGGLSCDSMDYYNSEAHIGEVFMPVISERSPLYLGFFHTGAYQESLGGYGGIQHCLLPSPKHIIIGEDEGGRPYTKLFREEQKADSMLKTLGYTPRSEAPLIAPENSRNK